jgi:hypothetical protein
MSFYPCSKFENKNTTKCILEKYHYHGKQKATHLFLKMTLIGLKFMFVLGHYSTKHRLNKNRKMLNSIIRVLFKHLKLNSKFL